MTYRAPVAEIAFTLKHVAGLSSLLKDDKLGDLEEDVVDAILEEAGKFASDRLAPLNVVGDTMGATLADGAVSMPDGWTEAYQDWVEAGWSSLAGPEQFGGQGLPISLSMACSEMWNAASMAFALNPLLTQGAVHALHEFGSDTLKQTYLPKMISGEWTGSMQLTEPQSGSDLSTLKTKAIPQTDGTYRLSGTKIFITYGEHPMTENIIHLVLARLPDAPPGTKGISLFLVPKFLVAEDGSLGARNDIVCSKLEHKIGIHGSPTCVMNLGEGDGAIGWLVGEENKGLAHMFLMMNEARLAVGTQGVGIASRSYAQALDYACERKQGRSVNTPAGEMAPIIEHPDVRRMLMAIKSSTSAARAIALSAAVALDKSVHAQTDEEKETNNALSQLLTPVAKAYGTDVGVMAASEGVQVHGGMGYIEETGAAQHYRDARIAPIYEGTNGIQAMDLVMRKLPMAGGKLVLSFIDGLKADVAQISEANDPAFGASAQRLDEAVTALEEATKTLLAMTKNDPMSALAVATPYLRLLGLAAGGALLGRGALISSKMPDQTTTTEARIAEARFFAEQIAPEAVSLRTIVTNGADALNMITPEMLTQ